MDHHHAIVPPLPQAPLPSQQQEASGDPMEWDGTPVKTWSGFNRRFDQALSLVAAAASGPVKHRDWHISRHIDHIVAVQKHVKRKCGIGLGTFTVMGRGGDDDDDEVGNEDTDIGVPYLIDVSWTGESLLTL